jgi:hypothetical protein
MFESTYIPIVRVLDQRAMNYLNKLLYFGLAAFLSVSGALAQNNNTGVSGTAPAPLTAAPLSYTVGEVLTYEGKISKIIQGMAVADLTFTVSRPEKDGNFVVKAEARSKGTLVKLFKYSFLQEIESTFVPAGTAQLTKKHDVQKERVRDSEAVFDYGDRQVTYTETDPKDPMRPPRRIASEIGPETYDIVSAIYKLRMLPLSVGTTFSMTVSDSGLVYKIPVKVTGREVLKTVLGKVACFRIEPNVFGPGRFIEKEGSMIIWITDDARRVPVRSQVRAPFGKVEIKLTQAKNLRS